MRKQWTVVVAVIVLVFLGVYGAAAQDPGPQGAGTAKVGHSSDASHSYNPIKWVKKDPNATTQKPKKTKNKKEKSASSDTSTPPK